MRILPFATFLLLAAAAWLPAAQADTMYKCVDANGKTTFADRPCPANGKSAASFHVEAPAPVDPEQVASDAQKLRNANEQFNQRRSEQLRKDEAQQQEAAAKERLAKLPKPKTAKEQWEDMHRQEVQDNLRATQRRAAAGNR
jgi:hypothetical protein